MLGVTIVGSVLTEVAYALTVGWGINNMTTFANSSIPGIIIYTEYMGIAGGLLLALFAFNSAFSDSVAMQSNAGRVYFAMGRDGILPRFFSYVDPKRITPTKALAFVGISSSILAIFSGFIIGYYSGVTPQMMLSSSAINNQIFNALSNAFDFLTTIALVGFIVAHFINNTAVMTLFSRLHGVKESVKGFIVHYILPALATVVFAFVLYESIYPPVFPVTQAVIIGAILLTFSIIYAYLIKIYKPQAYKNAGRLIDIVEEEKLSGEIKE